ncbi:hypothetical protein E2C01_079657 [Portunus trituberculatus]|uniref:Uncharacterized protein n=1 Tax=Portunus trituberculatus TaxID=210409 RepID=A0A5B7IQW2_PORTR|nr:hypothetical protein [Portunus trituberculatus]
MLVASGVEKTATFCCGLTPARGETGEEDDFLSEGLGAECRWIAPEVKALRPVFASGDVFSLGFLLQQLAESCICCAREEPSCRPCLPKVAPAIAALQRGLLQLQLHELFHLMVRQ